METFLYSRRQYSAEKALVGSDNKNIYWSASLLLRVYIFPYVGYLLWHMNANVWPSNNAVITGLLVCCDNMDTVYSYLSYLPVWGWCGVACSAQRPWHFQHSSSRGPGTPRLLWWPMKPCWWSSTRYTLWHRWLHQTPLIQPGVP